MSKQSLYEKLKVAIPELTDKDFLDSIMLRNDGDDAGDYIYKWEYKDPLPEGFTVGK